jgi:hypothetical protein
MNEIAPKTIDSLVPGTIWEQPSSGIIIQIVTGPFCEIFPDFSREGYRYPIIRPIRDGDIPRRFVKFTVSSFVAYRYLKGVSSNYIGKVTHCYAGSFLFHNTLIENA